ncbi:hypothetical protein J3Q64DRAFT_1845121 [Phycomyces blakesleeanus]|uniref:Uncharacterized protein n=1 Tax=Phycomyces blakesleeanus TaxID=4837 RepID=A0ABR3BHQ5_PHYBL
MGNSSSTQKRTSKNRKAYKPYVYDPKRKKDIKRPKKTNKEIYEQYGKDLREIGIFTKFLPETISNLGDSGGSNGYDGGGGGGGYDGGGGSGSGGGCDGGGGGGGSC